MGILITNRATELIIYDEAEKNVQFIPKTGTTVSAASGKVLVVNGETTYVNATPNEISSPVTNGLFEMVDTIHGYIDDNPIGLFSGGWGDYKDTATTGTPITLTGGAGFTQLTNNKATSDETKLPFGVDTLWSNSTNRITLTGLSVGDVVGIRATFTVTVATTNTEIDVQLAGGASGTAFTVPIGGTTNYKTAKAYTFSGYSEFYIKDTDTLDNGVLIRASSEKTCTVTVVDFFIKAIKVGHE